MALEYNISDDLKVKIYSEIIDAYLNFNPSLNGGLKEEFLHNLSDKSNVSFIALRNMWVENYEDITGLQILLICQYFNITINFN